MSQITKFNEPIYHLGKFEGEGPFEIQISGKVEDNIFSRRILSEVFSLDSLAQETWIGTYMRELEKMGRSQEAFVESLQERILVNGTAFVIRNADMPCNTCVDESGNNTTAIKEISGINFIDVSAVPNPFRNEVKLSLSLPDARDWSNYHFGIYNLNGQLLQVFQTENNINTNQLEFTWNPDKNIIPGMYIFVIQSPQGKRSVKLIKL